MFAVRWSLSRSGTGCDGTEWVEGTPALKGSSKEAALSFSDHGMV